jgi:predicted 2-oxoglutarate/Fe(II)-dependent dioxygenase YbiX
MPPDILIMNVFDADACETMLIELRSLSGDAATVYGRTTSGAVDAAVRKTTRITPSLTTRSRVLTTLIERRGVIEEHFGASLGEPEDPQFLRYAKGDYFVAHQDGNSPMVLDHTRFRRVSVVLFLNAQSDHPQPGTYGGGSLVIHGSYPEYDVRHAVDPAPGMVVAFRSETTHEVMPVTHGERYTVVSWYRGPEES